MNELRIIKQAVDECLSLDTGKNKKTIPYVRARSIYYELACDLTPYSYMVIGGLVGRDHATITHARKYFERDILKDDRYAKKYLDLLSSLKPIFEGMDIDSSLKEAQLRFELKELKQQNEILKGRLKKRIDPENDQEMQLINRWRSLDQEGRKDAIFKIETAKKVRQRIRGQKRQTA
jgi:hypothetical protein